MFERRSTWIRNNEGGLDLLKPGTYSFGSDDILAITRVIITIADERLNDDGYGRLPTLDQGIDFFIDSTSGKESLLDAPTDIDATEPARVHETFDWAGYCFDYKVRQGTCGQEVIFRYTLARAGAQDILTPSDSIGVEIGDDLYLDGKGLLKHRFCLQYEVLKRS